MAVDIIARGMAGAAGETGETALKIIAQTYDPTYQYYNPNDIVIYDSSLWICIGTNVTGEFDPTKWNQIVLSSEITKLINKVDSMQNPLIIKGTVATVNDLPSNAESGWLYFVGAEGADEYEEYVYTEDETWERIGTSSITVDSELSTTSINPVQNRVVTNALNEKYPKAWDVSISQEDYSALGYEKYIDGKCYFVDDVTWEDIEPTYIMGWHVDPSVSDPYNAITYLEDAVGMTPASMGETSFNYGDWENVWFMPKPCMLKFDGTVDYYLNPNDYTKKADGTASDVGNTSYAGNAMMEWPLIWYKYEPGTAEGEGYFYCSNRKVDDTYNCWCNYDANDNIIEHFYTAIYNGTGSIQSTGSIKMRSISGLALTSDNGNGNRQVATEIKRATENNTTDNVEWYIDVWSDRMLVNGLLILIGKSLNSQAVFGRGLDSGGQAAKISYVTGTLNDKGLFYGVTTDGNSGVKVFGMENWWGCVNHRTAGLLGASNNSYAYKLTYGTADGSTVVGYNTDGTGYLTTGENTRPSVIYGNTFITKAAFGKFGYLPLEITDGSDSTYYCDPFTTGSGYVIVGGSSNNGTYDGVSYVVLNRNVTTSDYDIAASLSCKPIKKEA